MLSKFLSKLPTHGYPQIDKYYRKMYTIWYKTQVSYIYIYRMNRLKRKGN